MFAPLPAHANGWKLVTSGEGKACFGRDGGVHEFVDTKFAIQERSVLYLKMLESPNYIDIGLLQKCPVRVRESIQQTKKEHGSSQISAWTTITTYVKQIKIDQD